MKYFSLAFSLGSLVVEVIETCDVDVEFEMLPTIVGLDGSSAKIGLGGPAGLSADDGVSDASVFGDNIVLGPPAAPLLNRHTSRTP